MSMSNTLRYPVVEAFDCGYPSPGEVITSLGGTEEAGNVLGRLWKRGDILPGDIIDCIHTDWPEADRRSGTFGALAQCLIRYMQQ